MESLLEIVSWVGSFFVPKMSKYIVTCPLSLGRRHSYVYASKKGTSNRIKSVRVVFRRNR